MVICAIVGCSNRSDDGSGLSFYGIPTVTDRYGKAELELCTKRRDGFLAAISREDLDMTMLHKYKVCEIHFHSCEPAYFYNTTASNWLPTLNLGHKEHGSTVTRSLDCLSVDRMEEGSGKGAVEKDRRIAASFSNRRNPINSSRRD